MVAKRKKYASDIRVAHLVSELFPYSKTGGLSHAVADMAAATARLGTDVTVFTPLYGRIRKKLKTKQHLIEGMPIEIDGKELTFSAYKEIVQLERGAYITVIFIEHYKYFGRYSRNYYSHPDTLQHFYFFCHAVIKLCNELGLNFDLIQCHDWMTALMPQILKVEMPFKAKLQPKLLLTIHNLAFQGSNYINLHRFEKNDVISLPASLPKYTDKRAWQKVNFLKRGIKFADAVSTVSDGYALEITTREYGEGLHSMLKRRAPITGIVNGIDHRYFDPQTSRYIWQKFNRQNFPRGKQINKQHFLRKFGFSPRQSSKPLIVMTQRVTYQKGFDILVKALPELLKREVTMVVMGEGMGEYIEAMKEYEKKFRRKFRYHWEIDEELEHQAIAAADIILVPSRYEPCGTSHMKAMRFGVVPVVRRTGGLSDTISDYNRRSQTGTGFMFLDLNPLELLAEIDQALQVFSRKPEWQALVRRVMGQSFTWDQPALEYQHLYEAIVN